MNGYHLVPFVSSILLLSTQICGAQTITGAHTDLQRLSETVAFVPDVPNHVMVQATWAWKAKSSDPKIGDEWGTEVEQVEGIDDQVTIRGHTVTHHVNGDLSFQSFEGAGKIVPQDKGPPHVLTKGSFTWTGGTGTHNMKGTGTYHCEVTFPPMVQGINIPGQCEWQGEPKFASQ